MPLPAAAPSTLPNLTIPSMLSAAVFVALIASCGAPTPDAVPTGKAGAVETATPYARPPDPIIVTSTGVVTAGGAAIATTPGPAKEITYAVESGDTLLAIAARFDTTVEALIRRNNLTNAATLRIGQELVIPGGSTVLATITPTATRTATPSAGGTPSTTATAAATVRPPTPTPAAVASPAPTAPSAAGSQVYVVVDGDIANAIAFKFGITLIQLAQANNRTPLSLVNLQIGERLIIPAR